MGNVRGGFRRGGVALGLMVVGAWVTGTARPASAQGPVGLTLEAHAARGPLRPAAYEIVPASSEVQIDGRMDEPAWSSAVRVSLPFEVSPGENTPAPVLTDCRLTYDESRLFLGCSALDPDPDAIRAFVTDRDGIDGHDRILLTLDPFRDQRRAFQFGISALGVQSDAVLSQGTGGFNQGPDGQPVDPSWDAIWSSAGRITDEGYTIEASIPFQSLRFPSGSAPQTWGMILTRWHPRSASVQMRSAPLDPADSCVLCQVNELAGLHGMTNGRAVSLTPTLTASRVDARPDGGPAALEAGPTEPSAGLDAQWGVTSDLTLNLTLNPDFSQVEADVAQLDVNNRFALFFPEKRPFFLEGADFFGTPLQAVFTRSIAEPTVGTKATGKVGDTGVGLLVARDRVNNLLLPGSEGSDAVTLQDETTTLVARARRDVGGSSSVGGLMTTRLGEGYRNVVGGFDLFARPIPSVTVQAQALRSTTDYPASLAAAHDQAAEPFGGNALLLSGRWGVRNWSVNGSARRVSEGFRADAGFVPQAAFFGRNVNVTRIFRGGADRWFTQIRMEGGLWRQSDLDGNVLDGGHWFGLMYQGPAQSFVGIWPNFVRKYADGRNYEGLRFTFTQARINPNGHVGLGISAGFGDEVDYGNGGVGSILRISPDAQLRVGRNFEAELSHTYQRMDREGGRVFSANLTRVRGVYSFSPRSFVRSVLQRQVVTRSQELNGPDADRASRWRFVQFTYGYKVNPQTVLFLGYGEDLRGGTDARGMVEPLSPDVRSFFLKLGYAWRP